VPRSPYAERFFNGATLYPRMLVFVVDAPMGPMGSPQGLRPIHSRRSALDKAPWRRLPDHTGIVEEIFLYPTYLGEHLLPFRLLEPGTAVVPYDGSRLLSDADERIDRYPGFAEWWRGAEQIWGENRSSATKLSLLEQLDYMHKLSAQFPAAPLRVVYSKAGNYLTAAVLADPRAVVENALYWATVGSIDEARYLTAVLNAPVVTELVRPLMSVGAFGPRHFDKYVWYVPIPEFDANSLEHRHIVILAKDAERVAASIELAEDVGFQRARRLIRDELIAQGVFADIDQAVSALVGRTSAE
jgi:hypothetical protein